EVCEPRQGREAAALSIPSRRRGLSPGRIAQRESARFTRGRSLVRSQVRPFDAASLKGFGSTMRFRCAGCARNERLVQTPVQTSFPAFGRGPLSRSGAVDRKRVIWPRVDREVAPSQDNVVQFIDWALGWFQTVLNRPFYAAPAGWASRRWNHGEPWLYFNY